MKFHAGHFFRAVILAAFGLLFLKLHITDEINKYINPKYELLSQLAVAIFFLFFFIQLCRVWERPHAHHCDCGHDHDHSTSFSKKVLNYSIILFPLVTGFSLAPAVLDASIAEKKGIMLQGSLGSSEESPQAGTTKPEPERDVTEEFAELEAEQKLYEEQQALPNNNYLTQEQFDEEMARLDRVSDIIMDEAVFEPYYEKISMNPEAYVGKRITVSGFIYKEEGFAPNQLVVSRYLITHCIADASIIGFLTEFEQGINTLQSDSWIELQGTLGIERYNGAQLPIVRVQNWKIIDQPREPYVYPVFTEVIK